MIVFYLTSGFFGISVLYSTLNIYNSTYENNKYSNNTKTHIKVAVYTHTPKKHTNTINSNFKTQPINKISPFYASTFSLCKLISMFVLFIYSFDSQSKKCHQYSAVINYFIVASASWKARTGRWRMADSGQDPSLSLAWAHQTQEVLSKVGLHSFIHETKLDYRLTDYVVSLSHLYMTKIKY